MSDYWDDREARLADILRFARGARRPDGYGRLSAEGTLEPGPLETLVNARMAYSFSIGALAFGDDGWRDDAAHAIRALATALTDPADGGYRRSSASAPDDRRSGYDLCFVALAAATAIQARVDGAQAVLDNALGLIDVAFWAEDGFFEQSLAPGFVDPEPYVGGNVNMHALEAFLAIAEATGDPGWLARSLVIVDRIIDGVARAHDWLLPEHYRRDGSVIEDFNVDRVDDEFLPPGVTVGHLFEWSRLVLELEAALVEPPEWLRPAARALYETARSRGWEVDGAQGFVYTVDAAGAPLSRRRMHWVVCEAIAASRTWADLGDHDAAHDTERWEAYAEAHLVDRARGSWEHELDAQNRPSSVVFSGKPDVYHIVQALGVTRRRVDARGHGGSARPGRALVDRARGLMGAGNRVILGIAGAPGSGKSTLAEALAAEIPGAVVVPMDGFHLAQRQLAERGLADRKGAPDTFDAAGFHHLLARLRADPDAEVFAPAFDRSLEEPIAGAVRVGPGAHLVIVEGNYLLVEDGDWGLSRGLFDEVWYLDVAEELRVARLVARHRSFGRTAAEAEAWVASVDGPNAALVSATRPLADAEVFGDASGWLLNGASAPV